MSLVSFVQLYIENYYLEVAAVEVRRNGDIIYQVNMPPALKTVDDTIMPSQYVWVASPGMEIMAEEGELKVEVTTPTDAEFRVGWKLENKYQKAKLEIKEFTG